MTLETLRKLVSSGEGINIEFKQKLTDPDKILKEMAAFANTKGGYLLVGVTDNGTIPGIRDPYEVTTVLQRGIEDQIFPKIQYVEAIIPVTSKRSVVSYQIYTGRKKPYYVNPHNSRKGTAYYRFGDQSIKASRELLRILKEKPNKEGCAVQLTELHHRVIRLFKKNEQITLQNVIDELKVGRRLAGNILTSLVLTNILGMEPADKGDFYYHNENDTSGNSRQQWISGFKK